VTGVGRVAPRGLRQFRLIVSQGVEVCGGWASNGITSGGGNRQMGVLVRNITDRR
jgi:hypothetical protein